MSVWMQVSFFAERKMSKTFILKYSFDLLHHVTDFLEAVAQKAIKLNFLAILIFDKKAFR